MSEFLPKFRRLPPIILLVFLISLFFFFVSYQHFKTNPKTPPPTETRPTTVPGEQAPTSGEPQVKTDQQGYENLRQEIKSAGEEAKSQRPLLFDECLWLPPSEPKRGLTRLDFIKENVYDYFIEGEISSVEERNYQGCLYTFISFIKAVEFTVVIPKGLLGKTESGDVLPAIYKNHLGQRVEMRVRYQENLLNPKMLKIIEWQPTIFYLN